MNVGRIITSDCVNTASPPDPRCGDDAFRIANPNICPVEPFLIVKPAFALSCPLGSVQFKAFYVKGGLETDVTANTIFTSSDDSIAVVGAISGNATALLQGAALITATYQSKTAQAEFTVIGSGTGCCDNTEVAMMVMVDTSKSMSLAFSSSYTTRLTYAKAAASRFISEVNQTKDLVGLMKFNKTEATVLASPTSDKVFVGSLVSGINQTQQLTTFFDALTTGINELNLTTAGVKMLVVISDGEDTSQSYLNGQNPIQLLADFKAQGGIVLCLGCRASSKGFALLSALATGGFFINGYLATQSQALDYLSGLKGYVCAGNCTPEGDVVVAHGALNYTGFTNWDVIGGSVDLQGNGFFDFLPGNGLYVDLAGTNPSQKGRLSLKTPISLISGDSYRLSVELSGNQRENLEPDSARVRVFYLINDSPVYVLDQSIVINDFSQDFHPYNFTFTAPADVDAYISIQQEDQPTGGDARIGLMLNSVRFDNVSTLTNLLLDNFDTENPTYVPPRCGQGSYYIPLSSVPTYTPVFLFDEDEDMYFPTSPNDLYPNLTDATLRFTITLTSPSCATFVASPTHVTVQIAYTDTDGNPQTVQPTADFFLSDCSTVTGVATLAVKAGTTPQLTMVRGGAAAPDSLFHVRVVVEKLVTTGYGYAYGYSCYGVGCLDTPPASQLPDPSPLADIEQGYTPPKTYASTKTACATCPAGSTNIGTTNLVPVLTGNTGTGVAVSASSNNADAWKAFDGNTASAPWQSSAIACNLAVHFTTDPVVVSSYKIFSLSPGYKYDPAAWTFEGSNNGTTWTVLDTRSGISWFSNEAKQFQFANDTEYAYYRLNITASDSAEFASIIICELQLFGTEDAQVCKSASATSDISQADADAQAYAAALALANAELNCQPVYESTQQYIATCAALNIGSFGQSVTKSATATSLVSQDEADAAALLAARTAAETELDCSLSNNTQAIVINDAVGSDPAPATPYPSVQHVTGLTGVITKVTVWLKKFTHIDPDDVHVLLRSPSGTLVEILRNAGGTNNVSNLDLVFDDAAGSALPDAAALTSGTWKTSLYGLQTDYPVPCPAGPYGIVLADFIGEDPNGSWSLWVMDDLTLGAGSIANGFLLTITTA